MAIRIRRKRGVLLLAMGFVCASSTASLGFAQDFINRYQSESQVSQVGYYDRACGGCNSPGCTSCTPSCGNGCAGTVQAPGVPQGSDYYAPMLDPDSNMTDMPPNMAERDLNAPVAPSPMLASDYGASAGGFSSAPNVIGDFFGGGLQLGSGFSFTPGITDSGHQEFASATVHGGDRLLKITEFNSPIPVDRVFFTYNHFHNALQESIDGTVVDRNLDRFVFGAEKTFNQGNSSIEMRIPFAAGLDAVQNSSDSISEEAVEFGDLSISLKTVLLTRERSIVTGGLGITLPTAADSEVTFNSNTLFLDNEAFHLSPYVGILGTPTDRLFLQSFLQFNFDLNGNSYATTGGDSGVIQDQTLMFLSGTVGYWIYRDPCNCNYLTGIAPVLELHYTSTLSDADDDGSGGSNVRVSNNQNRIDVLNLTVGTHFQLGPLSTLTGAVVVPLKEEQNRLFDAELGIQFNRRF